MGLCDVILVGDEDALDVLLAEQGLRPEAITIVDEKDPDRLGLRAVELVSSGKADILVKGKMNTSDFLRAVLNKEVGLRTGRQLNVLTCYDVPTEPKLFFITDGGMTIAPTLADKVEILHNAVPVLHHMGIAEDRDPRGERKAQPQDAGDHGCQGPVRDGRGRRTAGGHL